METFLFYKELIEISFYEIFGFFPSGLLGFSLALSLIYLLILVINKEKRLHEINVEESDINDLGDPLETKINLARSFIEMGNKEKSKELLEGLLNIEKELSDHQKERIKLLLARFNN